jgi:hypothetical protein
MKWWHRPFVLLGAAVVSVATTLPAQAATAAGWQVAFEDQYGSTANSSAYYSVVAPAGDDVWAFGTDGAATSSPVAEQYTDGAWQQVTLPSGLAGSYVGSASASSASNVWAVTQGSVLAALEWNGSRWSIAHTWNDPGSQTTGVTALSPTDVWVFGAGGFTGGIGTWHFNGTTWTEATGAGAGIDTASAVSSSDIWAVGSGASSPDTRIVHYINGAWHKVSSTALEHTTFLDVLALSAGDVWVDGTPDSGPLPARLDQFNGTTWTQVTVPWKVTAYSITSDGAGGIWLTALPAGSSSTWLLLHRTKAGTWSKTALSPAGAGVFGLSQVNGTRSVVGAGGVPAGSGTAAAVYLHGSLGS